MSYSLEFHEQAYKEWQRLDGSIRKKFKKILERRLDNPHVASAALKGELAGYYKVKLRQEGFRLIYRVIENEIVVFVIAVGKRDKLEAYLLAIKRE